MDHRARARRARIVALAAAMLPVSAAALAKEVRYPAAHPQVMLQVPDDWSVAETPLGLELQSPQKDALVLAGLTGGDRKSVDGWSKRALERMSSDGVAFAKAQAAGAAKPHVAGPDNASPESAAKTPDAAPNLSAADVAKANGDKPYIFGGAPLVDPLKAAQKDASATTGGADMPSISTGGFNPATMKPIGHYAYTGGTLRGQPVDVELAVFPLDKDKRLLIEQQSGPTDARGVMIVRSLRNLTQ